ncbi:hypothetical protein [Pseudoalteromonas umbrosa]|uniref:hypothetical protein n=1 Tax=Pseudoalteromonas umbrosa TaxID=3048489 RepID=UPI0024C25EB3|nr:hypothetical protein [Pseudoalteromonas sp. B95]MDK1290180.1 hypothetical protein [Pseudoalteromonas sp. B95]
MTNIIPDAPKAERVGDIIFCDKLPYPTDYIKQKLTCVVFVPNDDTLISIARHAIIMMINHGRLRDDMVRLRRVADGEEYDFDAMIQGVLEDITKAEASQAPKIITDL